MIVGRDREAGAREKRGWQAVLDTVHMTLFDQS